MIIWIFWIKINATEKNILVYISGIASGVILYVVFFEIFPKAKLIGGTGTQHMFAMIFGFLIFLPSLYFRKKHLTFGNHL